MHQNIKRTDMNKLTIEIIAGLLVAGYASLFIYAVIREAWWWALPLGLIPILLALDSEDA